LTSGAPLPHDCAYSGANHIPTAWWQNALSKTKYRIDGAVVVTKYARTHPQAKQYKREKGLKAVKGKCRTQIHAAMAIPDAPQQHQLVY
jgi:hypothetical protein